MKNVNFWERASKSRLYIALGIALFLLLILPYRWPVELRGLMAWDGAVIGFLALAWCTILTSDAARTRQLSRREDEHRSTINTLLLIASVSSMGGVLMALSRASNSNDAQSTQLTLASIATVALSWALIQTIYAFHYAHLYYAGEAGGVDFHGDEPPDYLDFCYLSFAVGTTFGATDSEIGGRPIRRTILKHGILSFTFATVIVALTLSVISSLLGGS